jgi:hypothetical protein
MIELAAAPLRWNDMRGMLWIGQQFELPTGDEEKHLGSGHFGWLPYLSGHFIHGQTVTYVQGGARISLSSHEEEPGETHAHGSVIDPHEEYEATYRGGVLYRFNSAWSSEISVTGSTVLSGSNQGTTYLSLAPQLNIELSKFLEGQLRFETPISPDRRFDWRIGCGFRPLFKDVLWWTSSLSVTKLALGSARRS